jgi:hypothetical protein
MAIRELARLAPELREAREHHRVGVTGRSTHRAPGDSEDVLGYRVVQAELSIFGEAEYQGRGVGL